MAVKFQLYHSAWYLKEGNKVGLRLIDLLKFSTGECGLEDTVVEAGLGFTSPDILNLLKVS